MWARARDGMVMRWITNTINTTIPSLHHQPHCYMNLVVFYYSSTVCPKTTANNYFQSRSDTLSQLYNFLKYKATTAYHSLFLTGCNWMTTVIMLHLLRRKVTRPPHVLLGRQYLFLNFLNIEFRERGRLYLWT